jgi:hypothetical protein
VTALEVPPSSPRGVALVTVLEVPPSSPRGNGVSVPPISGRDTMPTPLCAQCHAFLFGIYEGVTAIAVETVFLLTLQKKFWQLVTISRPVLGKMY